MCQHLLPQNYHHLQNKFDHSQNHNSNTSIINDFNNINKENNQLSLSDVSSKFADFSENTFDIGSQKSATTQSVTTHDKKDTLNNLKNSQNNYDQTCDDATSLTFSQSSTDEKVKNKVISLVSPNNFDTKLGHSAVNSCHNGRESGYGTGGKNKYLLSQPSPLQTYQQQCIIPTTPQTFSTFAQR